MARVEVAAGLIRDAGGRYLLARRPAGTHLAGSCEFPGGKREADESLEECLRRELVEELGATFRVGQLVETVE
jgi:mutator protein MutT